MKAHKRAHIVGDRKFSKYNEKRRYKYNTQSRRDECRQGTII